MFRSASSTLLLIVSLFLVQDSSAQAGPCQDILVQAEEAYTQGAFDETIRLADQCLGISSAPDSAHRLAFRLKGLSYIGKGLESDARESVRRLLEIIPDFRADPIQDPPAFARMIEEVRAELTTSPATGGQQPATVQNNTPNTYVSRRAPAYDDSRNKLERVYWNWGIGFPFISYPDPLDTLLDGLEDAGASNLSLSLDILGIYFRPGGSEQLLAGFNINAWGDVYDLAGESLQFTALTLGPSFQYYVQNRVGDGVFLRGELGLSRIVLSGSDGTEETSEAGFGVLFGGGYAIPISSSTRLLIHVNYAIRRIEENSYNNLGIALSGLF